MIAAVACFSATAPNLKQRRAIYNSLPKDVNG
jgi:hypothetical protein